MRLANSCMLLALATFTLNAPAARAEDHTETAEARLDRQEQEIEALRQEVDDLRAIVPPPPQHPEYRREDGDRVLTDYLNPRVRLDVAGQVHPAMNVAGDGHGTNVYFVDNHTTGSRVRLAGVGIFETGQSFGTTLEVGFSPNNSFDVSQDSEISADFISVRRAELWVRDDRYGRIMFGLGSAATDNAAEFDLSLVSGSIMTSGVSFVSGGLQFTDGTNLTGVTLRGAFFNFDGQRESRIRYDSPMFGPLQVSASVSADQRYAGAITWGGDFDHWTAKNIGGITTLGAISIQDPNQPNVDFRVAGSWSMLHDASGLSATFSAGFDDLGVGSTPYTVYGKLGWDADFCGLGDTGFGVDYSWTENSTVATGLGETTGVAGEGQTVGLAVVQVIDDFGMQVYTQFRWYTLDRSAAPAFDDIFLGTVGALVRF